jgi:homoserine O-succinyltransferase
MPLFVDGNRTPTCWQERPKAADSNDKRKDCVKIALINNMPDAALEDTESQFFGLLDNASGDASVSVKLYSLPELPRSERGQEHLNKFYFGIEDLFNSRFDAVIMTGTEPRQSDLRKEPYWGILGEVLDWAGKNTVSTVLSCLAAHASVLHSDGIVRRPLGDKHFGVFEFKKGADHVLTSGTPEVVRFPHSRWNEVQEDALSSCGYDVLTKSAEGGVDLFVKKKKRSLFVHFQGHPEYGVQTLLKEYRRDVKRFLKRERETYPSMPRGYFDEITAKVLAHFRENALANPQEEIMASFPENAVLETLKNTWHSSATSVYRNWLEYVSSRKANRLSFAATAQSRLRTFPGYLQPKRAARP